MLAIVLGSLWFSTTAPAAGSQAPRAETFAAAGETHMRRAATAERPLLEFEEAHKNFDSAYLLAEEPRYLCRALAVTELALHTVIFADEQERLSWQELRDDDIARLRVEAEQAKRANCRFDAAGELLPPRVALLDPEGPPPERVAEAPTVPAPVQAPVARAHGRRARAHAIVGGILTTAGVGLLAGFAGVVGNEGQRVAELRGLVRTARGEGRLFSEAEDRRARELGVELLHGRDVAIGVGVAGLVGLTTGIAVLVAGAKVRGRRYSAVPYGGPMGAGVVLRLRF